MNAHIGEEVNRIILAPGKESINTKVQFHIQDAFAQLEAGTYNNERKNNDLRIIPCCHRCCSESKERGRAKTTATTRNC